MGFQAFHCSCLTLLAPAYFQQLRLCHLIVSICNIFWKSIIQRSENNLPSSKVLHVMSSSVLSLCRSSWLQLSASLSPGCGRLSCVPVSAVISSVVSSYRGRV